MRSRIFWTVGLMVLAFGCATGSTSPVEVDTLNARCAWCRMAVSDVRFAAQIVAPYEEPRIFDDVGCLRDWLRRGDSVPKGAVAYVADHRTKAWVLATRAVYSRVPGPWTPMASGLMAFADPDSRAADHEAAEGEALDAGEVFGARLPEGS